MSPIRPLEHGDLAAVADLFELVARSRGPRAPAGLAGHFGRWVLDQPFADPELPSLVYEDDSAGIVGFLASHPRPFRHGDRALRLACSGQLVAHPDFRARGVGALLLRRYLGGPQDITITDGATDDVRAMWEMLGGATSIARSVGWTRVLAPAAMAARALAARRGRAAPPIAPLDRLLARPFRPPRPVATAEPLTAGALLEGLERLARAFPLRPDYDAASLSWLLAQLESVTVHGPLVRRLVRDADGALAGWYVAYVPRGGVAQAMQVAGAGASVGLVVDELLHHARELGAIAVQGRVEPHLYGPLRDRRCLFGPADWAMVHARDEALLGALEHHRALLTRLEGEWWMGLHLLTPAELGEGDRAAAESRL